MSFTTTLTNSIALFRISLSRFFRGEKSKLIRIILGSIFLTFIWTLFYGVTYYMEITMVEEKVEFPTLHDIFHIIQLVLLFNLLYYAFVQTLVGLHHPFLMNDKVTALLQRLPIPNKTLYTSTQLMMVFKLAITSLFYSITFVPMLILGQFPWYQFSLIFATCYLAFLQIHQLSNLFFFGSKRFRKRIGNIDFLYDTGNYTMGLFILFPMVLGFLVIIETWFVSFNVFLQYWYIPLLNSSVALGGLVLRAGIPRLSFGGMISSLFFTLLLGWVNNKLQLNYNIQDELDVTLYKFRINNQMANSSPFEQSQDFALKPLLNYRRFPFLSPLKSIIYKDWLSIKRSKLGDKLIYLYPVAIPLTWYLISLNLGQQVLFYIFFGLSSIVFFLVQIIISFEKITILETQGIENNMMVWAKFIEFTTLHILIFIPLWQLNRVITIIYSLLLSLVLSLLHDREIIKSKFAIMFVSLLYLPLILIIQVL